MSSGGEPMTQSGSTRRALLAAAVTVLIAAGLEVAAQAPDAPRPAAEHGALTRAEGTWDASVEISMGSPGTPPQRSKAGETNRLCCGGLWLVSEFKSNPGSAPFEGHGITGYEPSSRKYTSTWVDSDLTTPMVSEGTYDATGMTLTLRGSMASNGKTIRWRSVEAWTDDDTRQYTMFMRGPDGKETPSMKIGYTRRK